MCTSKRYVNNNNFSNLRSAPYKDWFLLKYRDSFIMDTGVCSSCAVYAPSPTINLTLSHRQFERFTIIYSELHMG